MNIRATTARYTETSAQGPLENVNGIECVKMWGGGRLFNCEWRGVNVAENEPTNTHIHRALGKSGAKHGALCGQFSIWFIKMAANFCVHVDSFSRAEFLAFAKFCLRTRGQLGWTHSSRSMSERNSCFAYRRLCARQCVYVWLCTSTMRLCENKRISSDSLINTNLKNILINTAATHTHTHTHNSHGGKNVFAKTFRRVGENGIFGRI